MNDPTVSENDTLRSHYADGAQRGVARSLAMAFGRGRRIWTIGVFLAALGIAFLTFSASADASFLQTAQPDPTPGTISQQGSPDDECGQLGLVYYDKSDGSLGTAANEFPATTLTSGTPSNISWSTADPVAAVLVKAGSDEINYFLYSPDQVTSGSGLTSPVSDSVSHITFCQLDPATVTPTVTPTATPTPEPTADIVEPTATPTPEPTADIVEPTATPTPPPVPTTGPTFGSVAPVAPAPTVTPTVTSQSTLPIVPAGTPSTPSDQVLGITQTPPELAFTGPTTSGAVPLAVTLIGIGAALVALGQAAKKDD